MTEDEIKDAFISVANKLISDREAILEDLCSIQATLTDTAELENEQRQLAEQINVDADAITDQIARHGIRRREFGRFIHSVEKLPKAVTTFSEELWGSLVDHMTVYAKGNIIFALTSGMEIKA